MCSASLDATSFNNYRPISKLPFISKILEKVLAMQLNTVLEAHNICDQFQSGFRKNHSTETALLRVSNDILMAAECSLLVLLDLSAAFDTVDHCILINRLYLLWVFLEELWIGYPPIFLIGVFLSP